PGGHAQQVLPVWERPGTALHIPPAGRRIEIAASFHHDIPVTPALVYIVGQLPYATHQVIQPQGVYAFRIAAYGIELAIAQVGYRRIYAHGPAHREGIGDHLSRPLHRDLLIPGPFASTARLGCILPFQL